MSDGFEVQIGASTRQAESQLANLLRSLKDLQRASDKIKSTLEGINPKIDLGGIKTALSALKTEMAFLKVGDAGASRVNAGLDGQVKAQFDRASAAVRKGGDTLKTEAAAAIAGLRSTLASGAAELARQDVFKNVTGGRFQLGGTAEALKRQIADIKALLKSPLDMASGSPVNGSQIAALNAALAQAESKLRALADPLKQVREQTRDLGADVASAVMGADRRRQALGRQAERRETYQNLASTSDLSGASAERLKVGSAEATRVREVLRGQLESLKAQQAEAGVIAQKNRELEQAVAIERRITAEINGRKTARTTASTSTGDIDKSQERSMLSLAGWQAKLMLNYKAINTAMQGLAFGTQYVKDLDEAMRNLQAISGTTEVGMRELKATFEQVAEGTRFTSVEIAKAATVMAQAGMSTQQIKEAVGGVTLLATATGSTLPEAVDIATSIIGVFNVRAEEMGRVANQVTASLNLSKLTMTQLAQGIQYVGNLAADNNVSFSELAAVMSAMSNAGIRSGSTLGTGLRQMLIEFEKPTEKMAAGLAKVGLSFADVDVKSRGLITVLQTLKEAGFTTADAINAMDVRSAAAYSAISKFTDELSASQMQILQSNAAIEANAIQMQSFAATWDRFTGVFGAFSDKIGRGVLLAFRDLTNSLTSTLTALNQFDGALKTVGVLAFTVGVTALVVEIGKLVAGLTLIKGIVSAATAVFGGLVTALAEARMAMAAAQTASAALGVGLAAIAPELAAIAAVAGLGYLAYQFAAGAASADDFAAKADAARARLDELSGAAKKQEEAIGAVSKQMEITIDKSAELDRNEDAMKTAILEANQKFADQGLVMDQQGAKSGDLINALADLQRKLAEDYTSKLKAELAELNAQIGATAENIRKIWNMDDVPMTSLSRENWGKGVGGRLASAMNPMNWAGNLQASYAYWTGDKDMLARARPENALRNNPVLKEPIGKDINAIIAQGDRADINQIRTVVAKLDQLIQEAKSAGKSPFNYEQLQEKLNAQAAQVAGKGVKEARAQVIEKRDLTEAQFRAGAGTDYEVGVLRYKQMIDDLKKRVENAKNAEEGGKVLDEGKPQVESARKALTLRAEGMTGDEQAMAKKLYEPVITAAEHTLQSVVDEQVKGVQEANRIIGQENAETIRREIQNLKHVSKGEKGNSASMQAKIKQINALYDQLIAQELDDKKTELENKKGIKDRPDDISRALSAHKETLEQERQGAVESVERMYQQSGRSVHEVALRLDSVTNALKRKDKTDKDKYEQQLFDAEAPIREKENQIAAKKEAVARGRASDTEVTALEMELRDLKDRFREDNVRILESWATAVGQTVDSLRKRAEEEIRRMDDLRKTVENKSLDVETRNDAARTYNSLDKEHSNTENTITTKQGELEEVTRKLTAAKEELKAVNNEANDTSGWSNLWSNLKQNTQAVLEAKGAFKSMSSVISDLWKTGLETTISALGQALTDIATRSKTVGQAFRDMAKTILTAVLNMAANQAAASFMGLLFGKSSGTGNSGNSGNSGDSSGGTSTSGLLSSLGSWLTSLFYAGGPVRNVNETRLRLSTGSVSGVDVGRDTVNAVLRPGEFVMNTSAVDAVGEDYLASLNARGAAAMPAQMPVMPKPTQPAPVKTNVYVVSPDRAPQMGPSDVIATISDNILKGGSVKQLIKSVVAGRS